MCDTLEELYNTILSHCTVSQSAVDWEKASVSGLPTLKKTMCCRAAVSEEEDWGFFFVFCNVKDSTVSMVAEV